MAMVYLSFLGKGARQSDGTYDYQPVTYRLNGRISRPTKYVQAAEIELLQPKKFDRGFVVVTDESYRLHFGALKAEIAVLGLSDVQAIRIEEDFSPQSQWTWFQEIVQHIGQGDFLTVDLTHGYRAMSIVFSNAINFVQRVRRVVLEGVYYGAFESDRKAPPIVDMREFFIIHEWAEGVSRLVEDADARKLVDLANSAKGLSFGTLGERELSNAAKDLTEKIRNVDVHRVRATAHRLVQAVESVRDKASPVERDLLELMLSKFGHMAVPLDTKEKYDWSYFEGQIKIIRLLLEHQLHMQALTAMREMIASIGLIGVPDAAVHTSKGRSQRQKADVFIQMLQFPEARWNFLNGKLRMCESLMPHYQRLKSMGAVERIQAFLPDLVKYRNGMDHAWTSQKDTPEDLPEKAFLFLKALEDVVDLLTDQGVLSKEGASTLA